MRHLKSTVRGGVNEAARAVLFALVAAALLLPSVAAAIDPPDPLNVLFVANGWYDQEDDIEEHLLDLGCDVTVKKDYRVYGSTDLSVYDLIVITEFAPGLSYSALGNIESSDVPVLIVEYWDFWYSYRLGLTSTEYCGYVGTTSVEMVDQSSRTVEYVGGMPQVYSSSYTVYGISEFDLEPGVEPVAWSSESFDEYAVIIDRSRNIAATGVYETGRYTIEAWVLFDEIVREIAPLGPIWENDLEALQGFVDSGLWGYIDGLSGNESAESVRAYVWPIIFAYNLHDVLIAIEYSLQQKLTKNFLLYPPLYIVSQHPPYDDSHEDMLWFLGEHCNDTDGYIEASDYYVPNYGDKIWGVDLGTSVKMGSQTYFYMGDTWGNLVGDDFDPEDPTTWTWPQGCVYDGQGAVECNDSIVRLDPGETDPTDGVDIEVVSSPVDSEFYLPQTIPGVHRDYGDEVWDSAWIYNKGFSVPVGASGGVNTLFLPWAQEPYPIVVVPVEVPYARLWYGTQITRDNSQGGQVDPLAGKSWVGCSNNGTTFENCYRYDTDSGHDYAFFSKEKFVVVSPVEIGYEELDAMGDDAPTSTSNKGTLLFASTRPYRCSKLYLAYVDEADFGEVDAWGDPANVLYYTGNPQDLWSIDEDDAAPIFEPACLNEEDDFVTEEQQDVWEENATIAGARFEEQLWDWVNGPEDVPDEIGKDFSGCDYSGPDTCNPSTCWIFGNATEHLCTMCDQTAVDSCVAAAVSTLDSINYPWPETEGFGELSVKLVKQGGESAFVMLSNHSLRCWPESDDILSAISNGISASPLDGFPADGFDRHKFRWEQGGIFFRHAYTSTPWSWSDADYTGTPGYVGGIIDEFTSFEVTYEKTDLWMEKTSTAQLWFTASSWHGDGGDGIQHGAGIPGAYGVYTAVTEPSWVEYQPY